MNYTEITKALLALIIVGGAVYAALTSNAQGVQYLIGSAGIVIGAYFGKDTIQALGKALGFKKE